MSATEWHEHDCGPDFGDKPHAHPLCGYPTLNGTCGRPRGHTQWSIDTGWPHDTVSAYAHSENPPPYDAEVAPYLTDGSRG